MDRNAGLAIFELLDAHDLCDVLAIHGIVGRGIGEGNEDAHTGIIGVEASREIDAFFGGVDADGEVFKMIITRLGGSDAYGPGDFCPAADSIIGKRLC